jgi:hypothetical protein
MIRPAYPPLANWADIIMIARRRQLKHKLSRKKLKGRVLHLLLKPEARVDTITLRNKRGAFQAPSIRLLTNLSLLASVAEAPAPRS